MRKDRIAPAGGLVAAIDLEYLSKIPASVPEGRAVVHNHVRPTRRLGSRGFRAWLAEPSERLEVCGCDWAPELTQHCRVKRAG
jgi:hypothetical protein